MQQSPTAIKKNLAALRSWILAPISLKIRLKISDLSTRCSRHYEQVASAINR
jgi:hypothetical protein